MQDMKTKPMKYNNQKLKELRILAGKTMDEVALDIGMSKASISLWECKKRLPSPRSLRKLSLLFKVPISAFFILVLMITPAHAATDRKTAITAIVGEAANQGFDGMTAVGEVIRHRGSVKGIYGYKAMQHRTEPASVWAAAEKAWDRSATSDLTHGATLFENVAAFGFPKSWDRTKVVCVAEIKDHWFFTEI